MDVKMFMASSRYSWEHAHNDPHIHTCIVLAACEHAVRGCGNKG